MSHCSDIKRINLGTLPYSMFPNDDDKAYIYKRPNGHIYVYRDGLEVHVCCIVGDSSTVIIVKGTTEDINIPDISGLHLPDRGHKVLFEFNNQIYALNYLGNYYNIQIDWTLEEW